MGASSEAYALDSRPQAPDRKTFNWKPLILPLGVRGRNVHFRVDQLHQLPPGPTSECVQRRAAGRSPPPCEGDGNESTWLGETARNPSKGHILMGSLSLMVCT